MSNDLYPDRIELEVGPVRAIDLALYAAASGDQNPLHLDADVARAAGFERPIAHGMLLMAYAGRMVSRHLGAGSMRSFAVRFVGSALLGDRIALTGTLTASENGVATYEIRARSSRDTECLSGTARVSVQLAR